MKKILLLLITYFAFQMLAIAQDELKCEEDITSFISSKKNNITSARIVADNENSLTIEVELEGFNEDDFTLKGQLLSRKSSTALRGISSEKIEVPKGGGTVEITFRLNQNDVASTQGPIAAKYVKFTVSKSGGLLEGFEAIEGLNFSGTELVCACNKKWRISGAANNKTTVEVDLIPYKSANTINQGS